MVPWMVPRLEVQRRRGARPQTASTHMWMQPGGRLQRHPSFASLEHKGGRTALAPWRAHKLLAPRRRIARP